MLYPSILALFLCFCFSSFSVLKITLLQPSISSHPRTASLTVFYLYLTSLWLLSRLLYHSFLGNRCNGRLVGRIHMLVFTKATPVCLLRDFAKHYRLKYWYQTVCISDQAFICVFKWRVSGLASPWASFASLNYYSII